MRTERIIGPAAVSFDGGSTRWFYETTTETTGKLEKNTVLGPWFSGYVVWTSRLVAIDKATGKETK